MKSGIQYLTDEKGRKTSVVVPLTQWKQLNDEHENLLKKLRVFASIKNGLKEVAEAKKTGKKLQSLTDFLNDF